jgi:hypothetical protein
VKQQHLNSFNFSLITVLLQSLARTTSQAMKFAQLAYALFVQRLDIVGTDNGEIGAVQLFRFVLRDRKMFSKTSEGQCMSGFEVRLLQGPCH